MDAAHVVERHRLAKMLADRTVVPQRHGKTFQRLLVLLGVQVGAPQVVEHRSFFLGVGEGGEKFQGLLEILHGFGRITLVLAVTTQIVEGNPLFPGISGSLGLGKLLGQLLEAGLGFSHAGPWLRLLPATDSFIKLGLKCLKVCPESSTYQGHEAS